MSNPYLNLKNLINSVSMKNNKITDTLTNLLNVLDQMDKIFNLKHFIITRENNKIYFKVDYSNYLYTSYYSHISKDKNVIKQAKNEMIKFLKKCCTFFDNHKDISKDEKIVPIENDYNLDKDLSYYFYISRGKNPFNTPEKMDLFLDLFNEYGYLSRELFKIDLEILIEHVYSFQAEDLMTIGF